ncbi:hypothetical protein T02_11923 [Trichinella nativa]|uniref:PiggyBac transposable element-derived protein domain-containing protein n=1 Tax=Trichinella nativa TaxID=6335 RepID=A0A0V1L9P1_9BILA|nr:hypothetical protein T02_11923 [Trichinella nativa]
MVIYPDADISEPDNDTDEDLAKELFDASDDDDIKKVQEDRFRMKHCMPNKGHSWGLKVFCHCSSNGFLYDFLIAGDSPLEIKNGLGYIGADVVLKLCEELP